MRIEVISLDRSIRLLNDLRQHGLTRKALSSHVPIKGSTTDVDLSREGGGADLVPVEVLSEVHGAEYHHNGDAASSRNHHPGAGKAHRIGERSHVANRIREIREKQGLTQDQLAEMVGTTTQQISRLELGQRGLDVEWMERIAAALGKRPAALIDEIADTASGLPGEGEFAKDAEEVWLLKAWRALEKDEQAILKRALHGLASSAP